MSVYTIKDLPIILKYLDKDFCLSELKEFSEWISIFSIDDIRSYSKTFNDLQDGWYQMTHEKLEKYDFISGKPEENTLEKRPKAVFWWSLYCTNFMPYDHHCSSKTLKESMLKIINEAINYCNK